MPDQVGGRLSGVHRPREVEALGLVAAHPAQAAGLALELDALGDRLELEAVGQLDDRPDEGRLVRPVAMPSTKLLSILSMSTGKRRR